MNAPAMESPAPDFTALGDEDQESAKTALNKLSVLNGYAETFSVFAGEKVNIRIARKPRALLWQRPVHLRKVEIRDAVTGTRVATHKPAERILIPEQEPASYRDKGADYRCVISLDTTGWPPSVYECVVRDTAGRQIARHLHQRQAQLDRGIRPALRAAEASPGTPTTASAAARSTANIWA